MSNKNNPNLGQKGADSAISKQQTRIGSVASPDHSPDYRALGGKEFLAGSPKGTEAKPEMKIDGGDPILT